MPVLITPNPSLLPREGFDDNLNQALQDTGSEQIIPLEFTTQKGSHCRGTVIKTAEAMRQLIFPGSSSEEWFGYHSEQAQNSLRLIRLESGTGRYFQAVFDAFPDPKILTVLNGSLFHPTNPAFARLNNLKIWEGASSLESVTALSLDQFPKPGVLRFPHQLHPVIYDDGNKVFEVHYAHKNTSFVQPFPNHPTAGELPFPFAQNVAEAVVGWKTTVQKLIAQEQSQSEKEIARIQRRIGALDTAAQEIAQRTQKKQKFVEKVKGE